MHVVVLKEDNICESDTYGVHEFQNWPAAKYVRTSTWEATKCNNTIYAWNIPGRPWTHQNKPRRTKIWSPASLFMQRLSSGIFLVDK